MITMRMMQVIAHDVIGVIAVRDGGVTAGGVMDMACGFLICAVTGRAGGGVGGSDGDGVFV